MSVSRVRSRLGSEWHDVSDLIDNDRLPTVLDRDA